MGLYRSGRVPLYDPLFRGVSIARLLLLALLAALLYVAIVRAAFAQADRVAQCGEPGSGCTILAQPWVEFLQPYLTSIATVVAPVLVALLVAAARTYLHVNVTATQEAQLEGYATTQAGRIIASGAAGISSETIHVNDPRIAAAVNAMPANAKLITDALGLTTDDVAGIVHGAVGKMQSVAPTPLPAPPPVAPALAPA